MRICVVVVFHPAAVMGGAQYQCHLLAEELSRRAGVDVTFLARRVPAADFSTSYRIRRIGETGGIRDRAVLFDAASLWQALCDLRPDVIYQRMRQSYTAVCAAYARRTGAQLVFHVASDGDVDRRLIRSARRWTLNLPFEIVEAAAGNWGLRRATKIVVQTQRQAAQLRRAFHRDPADVIRNFQPLPGELPAKPVAPIKVAWIANIKAVKRPELFVQLAAQFSASPGIDFVMAGRPARHVPFTTLVPEPGRWQHLHYVGELSPEGVNALLCEAHIFVSTSRLEGSPNTFIQAWARGAVVVSLGVDVDGGMDAMGIGYHVKTPATLEATVRRLIDSPAERHTVARAAFRYVHEQHSLANCARLADLVQDLPRTR